MPDQLLLSLSPAAILGAIMAVGGFYLKYTTDYRVEDRRIVVSFDLSAPQLEKIRRAADRIGISPDALVRATLTDLLDSNFEQTVRSWLREKAG